jgi:hypothetical protein
MIGNASEARTQISNAIESGRSIKIERLPNDSLSGGVTYPWTLLAATFVGAYLLRTRLLFGVAPPLYFSDHVAGCFVIVITVTAWAEVARPVRLLNVPLGLWIAASPLLLEGGNTAALIGDLTAGLCLATLSLPRGTRSQEHYGGWDRYIV